MAQKVTVTMEDDLDGGPATETVTFAVDGTDYEIDLSKENAAAMRDALTPYLGHARRATSARPTTGLGRRRIRNANPGNIRVWAKDHGIAVSERGRIPADVVERYETRDATASEPPATPPPAAASPKGKAKAAAASAANGAAPKARPLAVVVDREEVRTWARGKGLPVKERGIIAKAITDQYIAEH